MAIRLINQTMRTASADVAAARMILDDVAKVRAPETIRISHPPASVAFGRQDRVRSGYPDAVRIATAFGYEPIERIAGGKAAVFHQGTAAIGWVSPIADSKSGSEERFQTMATAIVEALGTLGLAGTIREIPGEYCPGRFSVSVAGRKVAGIGQRVVAGAAHVGAVVVASGAAQIADVLEPIYEALDYDFVPSTTGEVGRDLGTIERAVVEALVGSLPTFTESLDDTFIAAAAGDADQHRPQFVGR